jgi:hypothetical protein
VLVARKLQSRRSSLTTRSRNNGTFPLRYQNHKAADMRDSGHRSRARTLMDDFNREGLAVSEMDQI